MAVFFFNFFFSFRAGPLFVACITAINQSAMHDEWIVSRHKSARLSSANEQVELILKAMFALALTFIHTLNLRMLI